MASDDTIILGEAWGELTERERKSGKKHTTIDFRYEPLAVHTDERSISQGPAEAIAEALRKAIMNVSAVAAPATLLARQRQAKAFDQGKRWAMRSFAGGRIGPMAPNQTVRQLNNSGRLAKSIVAAWADKAKAWIVNFAANRLNPDIIGEQGVVAVYEKLRALVPEIANAGKLLEVPEVKKAIDKAIQEAIVKGRETSGKAAVDLFKKVVETGRRAEEITEMEAGAGD